MIYDADVNGIQNVSTDDIYNTRLDKLIGMAEHLQSDEVEVVRQ
jgi:hypothetical protein